MTFYSDSNARTTYIDPKIYVPQIRASFELDAQEAAYLPNLRMTFIGGTGNQDDYNRLVGALAQCRNWRLMDGKQELCALNEAQFYQGFNNVNRSNSINQAVTSNLECTSLGWSILGENRNIGRVAETLQINTTTTTANSSYLDLRDIFPMLNSVSHLPTAVFKNLRIEVEFNTALSQQLSVDTANAFDTLRPVLVADVLENPKIVDSLNKQLKVASWLEVEHDQFVIPQSVNNGGAGDQLLEQTVNVQINGYNNKRIERLLIVKETTVTAGTLTGTVVDGWGKFGSQACFRQKIQYRVNGRNLLPRQGITGNNERLAHVVDTYGDCTAYTGSNMYGMDISDLVQDGRNYLGALDYIGVYIGDYINNLQINFQRTGLQSTFKRRSTTDMLIAHCYADVRKVFTLLPNGTYNISYAQ